MSTNNQGEIPTLYSSYPFPAYSPHDLASMTEVTFAKTFLSSLDLRPVKLSPDHVEDPKTYPARNAHILPKMARRMSKRKAQSSAPGSERSLTVTVKSLRNPPLDIKFTSQPLNTSILDLKTAVAEQTGILPEKIKVLFKKKPLLDSKVLKDLVGEGEGAVELSVMVLGGASSVAGKMADAPAAPDVAQGTSGSGTLATPEFWDDLKGFLLQRIRDEKEAAELFDTFEAAWKAKG